MTNKAMAGLALCAGFIAFLTVVYVFSPGGAPRVNPGKTGTSDEVAYRTSPEFASKTADAKLTPPPAQEPPAALPDPAAPPSGEKLAASGLEPGGAPMLDSPSPAAQEQYGLLVGRYRTHKAASNVLEKVQRQGKPAFIRYDGRQRQSYAVWVGPFPNPEESQLAAKAIKASLKVTPKAEKLQMVVPK